MISIDKRPLFGGYIVLFNQISVTKCDRSLFCGGLYSEVAFNTGLTVYTYDTISSTSPIWLRCVGHISVQTNFEKNIQQPTWFTISIIFV